jgi:uncharacterized membrane-anchored protein YitT (DUF2179 family)
MVMATKSVKIAHNPKNRRNQLGSLDSYRNIAQYFTMISAVLSGILWIAGWNNSTQTDVNAVGDALIVCTIFGGFMMGLLYAAHLVLARK